MGEVRDLSSAHSARSSDAEHELSLRAQRQAPRLARHWVMRVAAAAGVGGIQNQVLEVLTGELVAEAVQLSDLDGEVHVGLSVGADGVRVSVTGPCPPASTATPTSLALVEVLSSGWGTWPRPGGERTVWFDVEVAG